LLRTIREKRRDRHKRKAPRTEHRYTPQAAQVGR
jgi:hypothetical protein